MNEMNVFDQSEHNCKSVAKYGHLGYLNWFIYSDSFSFCKKDMVLTDHEV